MLNLKNIQTNVDAISMQEYRELLVASFHLQRIKPASLSETQKQEILQITQNLLTLDRNLFQYKPKFWKRIINYITFKSVKINYFKNNIGGTVDAFVGFSLQLFQTGTPQPPFFANLPNHRTQLKLRICQKAQQIFQSLDPNQQTGLKNLFSYNHYTPFTEFPESVKEVNEVFQKMNLSLTMGVNCATPLWTHSTKEHLFPIIMNSGHLKESSGGARGPGLYISSCDELSYGPITYAICPSAVENTTGRYFPGGGNKSSFDVFNKKWVAVRFDQGHLPINRNTIAYIAVNDARLKQIVEDNLKEKGIDIPVISRTASHILRHCFGKARGTLPIPKKWSSRCCF